MNFYIQLTIAFFILLPVNILMLTGIKSLDMDANAKVEAAYLTGTVTVATFMAIWSLL